ncbi:MAG: hypothetical protein J0L75_09630 [Spirochaetes bacterium]|nr:hypothetical protein [Spirochaetota bacterium]
MKPQRLPILLAIFLTLPAWAGEKGGHAFTLGVESSFGDLLTYPSAGFQFSLKPYFNWDVAGSGFVLSLAYGFPLAPWGGPTQLELIEEYGVTLNEKANLGLTFGNDNSLTFASPIGLGGFVYLNVGLGKWSLQGEFTYLDFGAFGFGKVSLVPGYTFEWGKWNLGLKLKFNLGLASAPATLGLEPLVSIDYTF